MYKKNNKSWQCVFMPEYNVGIIFENESRLSTTLTGLKRKMIIWTDTDTEKVPNKVKHLLHMIKS